MKINNRSTATMTIILTGLILSLAMLASASLAGRAGIWQTQPVEATLLAPDGAKASVDLGPARTAALGHLDSDGVVDLVVIHSGDENAFAAVFLGERRFRLGPHHDLERERAGLPPEKPFSEEATLYPLAFAADWAAIGDWNADGFFDLVIAARGVAKLQWLAGDGNGRLRPGGVVALEGAPTAFIAADVNRRDGLDDLLIGVDGPAGPAVLVFESAVGALMDAPERLPMPAVVTSLAADWLDDKPWKDIVAAAGEQLVLVSGRDRLLVLSKERRDQVAPAKTNTIEFDAPVLDLAVGHFVGDEGAHQLAVRLETGAVKLVQMGAEAFEISDLGDLPVEGMMLSARAAGLRGHDLLLGDPASGRIEIFHAAVLKAGGMGFTPVPAPETSALSVLTGRLNADTRDDLVLIGTDGEIDIAASKSRLAIEVNSSDDTDDGTCDATHCSLREAINYANSLPAGSTITFALSVGDWTIEPLSALPALTQVGATSIDGTVGSFPVTGRVSLQGASAGEGADGLEITGGNASLMNLHIRGFSGSGISLGYLGVGGNMGGNNTVKSCLIGLDETGSAADPNQDGGIVSAGDGDEIGGTAEGEGNVVSGNLGSGICVYGDDTLVRGNIVGTNIAGDLAVGNNPQGIFTDGLRTVIGSALVHGGNLASGNYSNSTDAATGITATSLTSATQEALIIGNTVGLSLDGTQALGNGECGILANSNGTTIGGIHMGNVIGATQDPNLWDFGGSGISIESRTDVQILANLIGTDSSGTVALENESNGISVDGVSSVIIGGEVAESGNLISGNGDSGIYVSYSAEVEIYGNLIGVAADTTSPLGNADNGVSIFASNDITIGSIGGQNIIAYNHTLWGGFGAGIGVVSGTSETSGVNIGPNSIHDNTDWTNAATLGIDLGGDRVTPNDALDADTGANGLQNFPEILSAGAGSISFQLHSSPSTPFKVLLYANSSCDLSGYGEGETYLGAAYVVTNTEGNIEEQVNSLSFSAGQFITATATNSSGDTSEFSQCFEVPTDADLIFADGFETGDTSAWDAK